jgi:hypothetical protein
MKYIASVEGKMMCKWGSSKEGGIFLKNPSLVLKTQPIMNVRRLSCANH